MKNQSLLSLILALILIGIGFILGRGFKPEKTIRYLPGKTIKDTVRVEVPYQVEVPSDPILPTIEEPIWIDGEKTIVEKVDTSKIIQEYITSNFYKETLFDSDTLGVLELDMRVQYNKLQHLGYSFTPIVKEISVSRKPFLEPFIFSTVSFTGSFGFGAGFYRNNIGFGVGYQNQLGENGISVSTFLRF